MTRIGSPPRTPQAWAVPVSVVADQFMALKTRALTAGLIAEDRHLLDPPGQLTLLPREGLEGVRMLSALPEDSHVKADA